MKNKILIFIIGVLVGAIIATIGFYIYKINTTNQETNRPEMMNMGTPPDISNAETGNPPEKPEGENMEEPPSMPSDENQNNGTSSSRKQKNKSSNVSTESNS